jgi:hypothetical protein
MVMWMAKYGMVLVVAALISSLTFWTNLNCYNHVQRPLDSIEVGPKKIHVQH